MIFNRNINYSHNKQAIEAFKTIMNTNDSLLLTGKARTGKTKLIKSYLDLTSKKTLVLAPNKLEAIKTSTVSVNSFFKIPENIYDNKFQFLEDMEYSSEHIDFIKSLELLIIDDAILISSAVLDCIDTILQKVRGNLKAFGGIQLILVGDLFEQTSFMNELEKNSILRYWKSEYFFDAKSYANLDPKCFELHLTYVDGIHYDVEMLYYSLGENTIDSSDLDFLNRAFADYNGAKKDKVILTAESKSAYSINSENLKALNSMEFKFVADFHGDVDMTVLPVEPVISLKKGAKVILMNNDKINGNYENGSIGTFVEERGDELCVILEDNSKSYIKKAEWIQHEYCLDTKSNEYLKTAKGIYVQYPVKLGWAISIEDSKGMMFEKLHFENGKVSNLEDGQVYAAYRRSHAGNGFSFTIPFRRSDIKADTSVMEFYNNSIRSLHQTEEQEAGIN